MPLTLNPSPGPGAVEVIWSPPTGQTLTGLARTDRNGRTAWTATDLGPDVTDRIWDRTCALAGPIEYHITWSDGTAEAAHTSIADTDPRPRLLRLDWTELGGRHTLTAPGSVWTEHAAVLDAPQDLDGITTVTRRGVTGIHAARNPAHLGTGQLLIWCETRAHAVNLRDDLLTHPLQWLRAQDQAGLDFALIVSGLSLRSETGAWIVDAAYTTAPDLIPTPTHLHEFIGRRTLAAHTGTLADLAATFDMLAEMR